MVDSRIAEKQKEKGKRAYAVVWRFATNKLNLKLFRATAMQMQMYHPMLCNVNEGKRKERRLECRPPKLVFPM